MEFIILEKPQKEADINLTNNKENKILIKKSNESLENKNPLITPSSNDQIEFINVYDIEKEGTKENNLKDYTKLDEDDKDTIIFDNKSKQVFENESNLNDINKIKETETEKDEENIVNKKPEIININDDNDKSKTEINNLNPQNNEVLKENEIKAERNRKAIEKIISILEEININTQKNILRNGFEIWKIYNNKIDEDYKIAKIESDGLVDSEENKKESEKVLNINNLKYIIEHIIIEKPQKEIDINLSNNKDNQNLVEGTVEMEENLENRNPLTNVGHDEKIEFNNINEKKKENEDKEKEEQKENYIKEDVNIEHNNIINIDNEMKEIFENKNNLNNIKKINETEPEKAKDNIIYQKSDILNIIEVINKNENEIDNSNYEKNETSKENEIITEGNKKAIEKIISILVKINYNIERNILKNGFEIWKNYNNEIDENDKKVEIENKIQKDLENNRNTKKKLEKQSETDLNINDNNNKKKPQIFEKVQKEIDNNLINGVDNKLLIEEHMKLNKSKKDKNTLIISSNEQIELNNIYDNENENKDEEKERKKENNEKEELNKEQNCINIINADNEPKDIFDNQNNLKDIKKINETEPEMLEENIVNEKPEIKINDENKNEINYLNQLQKDKGYF